MAGAASPVSNRGATPSLDMEVSGHSQSRRDMATTPSKPRLSAAERRRQIIEIALPEFARTGYFGTSTETIARLAGISHAYLFRLFGTKKELFLACAVRTCERTLATFREAAARWHADHAEPTVLAAMGVAYRHMLEDRELLSLQMQLWAACSSDSEIREIAREHYGAVIEEIERLSGADPETLRSFVAGGMLLNVAASMSLDELAGREAWASHLLPHHKPTKER
jgi:AcrR family transcriptional regulator